ncbi:hypothetical protein BC828DRAFT_360383 [Blastocladiella britannica]|nr:hypothetical protein BC828DRAFT_360383 [Blastocladiella britannica]
MVQQWQVIETTLANPMIMRKRDKIAFFLGVSNLWLSALLVGVAPTLMPVWYTFKCVVLIAVRWGLYRRRRWHYFLADFCYLINVMMLLFLWVMPTSATLFNLLFACSHGPLAWAIVTWRNSLVFHSLDKMTSVFIHLSPPLTLATLRWFDSTHSTAASPQNPHHRPLGLGESLIAATVVYAVWQAAYYIFILYRRRDKVNNQGYATSFTWLLGDGGAIARAMAVFGERHAMATFMLLQYAYSMVTVVPVALLAGSPVANIAFLVSIVSVSVWNAAGFYFDVFSKRYAGDVAKLEQAFRAQVAAVDPAAVGASASARPETTAAAAAEAAAAGVSSSPSAAAGENGCRPGVVAGFPGQWIKVSSSPSTTASSKAALNKSSSSASSSPVTVVMAESAPRPKVQ